MQPSSSPTQPQKLLLAKVPFGQDVFPDPQQETEVREILQNSFKIRYLYSRSSESQKESSSGQDALRIKYNQDKIVFTICDGVGQSFNGQIAAQFVSEKLISWLWSNADKLSSNVSAFKINLREYLNKIVHEGQDLVRKFPIPFTTANLVKNVLEEMRVEGSETTFSCGYVELPSDYNPKGCILLAWLGDSLLEIGDTKNNWRSDLEGKFVKGQHWSTHSGLANKSPFVWRGDISQVNHIMAYSDGFLPIRSKFKSPNFDIDLNNELKTLANSGSADDDVSFIEIILDPRIKQISPITLDQPVFESIKLSGKNIYVKWSRITNASRYKFSYSVNGEIQFSFQTTDNNWEITNQRSWKTLIIEIYALHNSIQSQPTRLVLINRNRENKKFILAIAILVMVIILEYWLMLR